MSYGDRLLALAAVIQVYRKPWMLNGLVANEYDPEPLYYQIRRYSRRWAGQKAFNGRFGRWRRVIPPSTISILAKVENVIQGGEQFR